MKEDWKNVLISEIGIAIYVPPHGGKSLHKVRPLHGFVINDGDSDKNYCFEGGCVMHTPPHSLFYLPKGSSYHVDLIRQGGLLCYQF